MASNDNLAEHEIGSPAQGSSKSIGEVIVCTILLSPHKSTGKEQRTDVIDH
jgi:hypothetical protein